VTARRWRHSTITAVGLLIWLIVRWVLVGPSATRIAVGTILALPFVLGAPLIYIGHRRSFAWLTLALAPVLALGLSEAVANAAMRAWAGGLLLAVLLTFLLLIGYLRATRSSSQL
jgi:hypothetical protein